MFTSSTIREIRHFHVVVVQRRQRNVQKSVMHVQSCYFANIRVRFFGTIRIRISDPFGSCRSNEPTNPCPEWIHRFIWSSTIRVVSNHWSWYGSSQRDALSTYCCCVVFVDVAVVVAQTLYYKTKTTPTHWDASEYQILNGNTVDVNEIYNPLPPSPFKLTKRIAELKIRFPTQRRAFWKQFETMYSILNVPSMALICIPTNAAKTGLLTSTFLRKYWSHWSSRRLAFPTFKLK